jgi:hypothetical protein
MIGRMCGFNVIRRVKNARRADRSPLEILPQASGGANAPVVQEIYCGLHADHVVVNRNNVESVAA